MFTEIEIELAMAAGIMLLSLLCVGKAPFFHPRELTITHFAIMACGIYFGFGPFASYALGGGSLSDENMEDIVGAYEVVALFIIGLASVPFLIRFFLPNFKHVTVWEIFSVALQISWPALLLIHIAVWVIRLIIGRYYGIFFYGTGTDERLISMPYSMIILDNILEFLGTSAFIWSTIRVWRSKDRGTFLVALLILATGFLWAIMQGRRPLFIHSIFFLYGYSATMNAMRIRQILFATAFLSLLLFVGFPAFFRLRMSHDLLGADDDGIEHVYRTAVGATKISKQELDFYYRDNMTERPLIIRFICKILSSQQRFPVMQGKALLTSAIWVIPTAIYSEKRGTLKAEQYIQVFYCQPLKDTSLTWAATGCADFGIPGGYLIGVFLGTLILMIELQMRRLLTNYPILAISAISTLLFILANVEADPLDVFSQIRTTVILYIVAVALRFFGFSVTLDSEPPDSDDADSNWLPDASDHIDSKSRRGPFLDSYN